MHAWIGPVVLVAIAIAFANLPFVSNRLFGIVTLATKPLALRVLEVGFGYGIVAIIAVMLERQAHGSVYPQGWEFYAITVCLFLVLAFPGFVFRYLWRQR